jgi:hypothetical protein
LEKALLLSSNFQVKRVRCFNILAPDYCLLHLNYVFYDFCKSEIRRTQLRSVSGRTSLVIHQYSGLYANNEWNLFYLGGISFETLVNMVVFPNRDTTA